MSKQVRYLRQVVSHLEEKYGSEKVQAVMTKAQKRYDELVEENRDEPKSYYMHTRERIYPSIAVFYALLDEGAGREEAKMFFYVDSAEGLAGIIGGSVKVLSEEPFYRHISKKGLNFSTKASMVISD